MLVGFERPAQSYQRPFGDIVLEELDTFPELSRRNRVQPSLAVSFANRGSWSSFFTDVDCVLI